MKQIYKLSAWNLRKAMKLILLVWAIMAAAELASQMLIAIGGPYIIAHSNYIMGGSGFVFAISYLAVLCICNFAAATANLGKAKSAYTLMTLPTPRVYLLISNIISSLLALLATIALQLILPIIYYPILTNPSLIPPHYSDRFASYTLPNGLFLSFMRNDLSALLFSTDFASFMAIFSTVICTTVIFCCIFFFKGLKRILTIITCGLCALLCLFNMALTNVASQIIIGGENMYNNVIIISTILFVACTFIFWRATKSLNSAKNI